jgi:hypothetical protein
MSGVAPPLAVHTPDIAAPTPDMGDRNPGHLMSYEREER